MILIEAEDYNLGGAGIAYHDRSSGNQGGDYREDDVDIRSRKGVTFINRQRGSGTRVQDVNRLLKQYRGMRKMMKGAGGKWLRRSMGI